MSQADEAAVLAFAQKLPSHDLLFLPRNISQPEALSAWVNEIERGSITSLLAVKAGTVVGCGTPVRDPHSWSPHVGVIRRVVSLDVGGQGVGRAVAGDLCADAGRRPRKALRADDGRPGGCDRAVRESRLQGRGAAARPCPGRRRQDAQHRRARAQCGAGPGPDGSLWVTRGRTAPKQFIGTVDLGSPRNMSTSLSSLRNSQIELVEFICSAAPEKC
jgi:hypothetical protein